ncbi:MAG TPA: hypothetical protein VMV49_09705 [Candidatus Deferrimicrobium sp.]|nr:hypothetical protein [Candidatus Deferrimicrobium sp.]
MESDLKSQMEKSISKDLEYILNYKHIAVEAKNAEYFSKMTIIKPIANNVYPQIYVDLIQRFDHDEAIRHLKSMGTRVSKYFYSVFPKMLTKPQKFTEIFSEVAESHLNSKLIFKDKVQEDKKLKSCIIEVKDCFFCSEITLFQNLKIPYCIPIMGMYENLYNIKSVYNKGMNPRLIYLNALKSAEYDGDTCEYKLTVID